MNIVEIVNRVTGTNTPFTFDIRYDNKPIIIIILKSTTKEYSFEPLVIEQIDFDFIEEKLEIHYDKIKDDYSDVEKFLGAKTAKQNEVIEEAIIESSHPISDDTEFDLDF